MKDVKDSFPVQLAEFTIAKGIEDEPAFAWWVSHTIKRRSKIISAIKSRMVKKTHKYGVELPSDVGEAYKLDEINKNTLWRDAIRKEMTNVMVAFDILGEDETLPNGLSSLKVHLIFDVKMDMTRKARLVADGHLTSDPGVTHTYASVVSRETVRIVFTYASLNGLDILAADILNAYLTAPTSDNYYIECGPEFLSELIGRKAIVKRALYGTRTACKDFRMHLRDCMEHLKYESCKSDPDLWMRDGVKGDGTRYYEYILLYVDDVLCVSEFPKEALKQLNHYFPIKPGSIERSKLYLGTKISQVTLPNGVVSWQ